MPQRQCWWAQNNPRLDLHCIHATCTYDKTMLCLLDCSPPCNKVVDGHSPLRFQHLLLLLWPAKIGIAARSLRQYQPLCRKRLPELRRSRRSRTSLSGLEVQSPTSQLTLRFLLVPLKLRLQQVVREAQSAGGGRRPGEAGRTAP